MLSNIEIIIGLVLLFMAVPDLCGKLGRPALVFPAFVLFGLALGPVVNPQVRTMLEQAGTVGFLLLLFEVGLEIDLPPFREFLRPLRRAVLWALLQYPFAIGLAMLAGFDVFQAFIVAAALTACSVGMAYPAWRAYPGFAVGPRQFTLYGMVALEMLAIILLAVETTALKSGLSWLVAVKLTGIAATIVLIAVFAPHLKNLFQVILERTTHWRVHWLVLLVLAVCAVGQRLGLDATKTAFFLGLAMSSTRHHGLQVEEFIKPISRGFLIPIFFVGLGMQIEWRLLFDLPALLALGTAGLLLGLREVLHRRWLTFGGDRHAFLLLCPNLTIVALAAKSMLDLGVAAELTSWLILTGLFMTIPSLLLLPAGESNGSIPSLPPEPASATATHRRA